MKHLLLLMLLVSNGVLAQTGGIKFSDTGTKASFRGLSVVDDQVIWASGSKGTVCRSTDGGKTFSCLVIPGRDSNEFRSVYGFDAMNALVCNIGSPAAILRTADGGLTWKEVYSNDHVAAFIDGIDFWNEMDGVVYGDPIDGYMMLLTTNDGGQTWTELAEANRPRLLEGESCFAASGTGIRCLPNWRLAIASGGIASRVFFSIDKGMTWTWVTTPIIQGQSSTGIFSFAFYDYQKGIIVGGDYKNQGLLNDHVFLTNDGGNNWQLPSKPTRGYREAVEYISDKELIAVGPLGTDLSKNGGLTWDPFAEEQQLHVVRKARTGKLIIVAGGEGKIGVLSF